MRSFRRPLLLIAVLTACGELWARSVTFGGMACDLPEGWSVVTSGDGLFAASSNGTAPGTGILQVSWFGASAFPSAGDVLTAIAEKLGAAGDASEFTLDGRPAELADVRFAVEGKPVRGYLLCLDTPRADVALLAYADEQSYDKQLDFLLSAMDSFRVSAEDRDRPGPVSQFLSPYPSKGAVKMVRFGAGEVPVRADPEELDAMQAIIEREARLLVVYAGRQDRDEAWKRYYRVVYRDGYPRLAETAEAIGRLSGPQSSSSSRASAVLSWLQGFGYARTGSLSDLLSPLSTIATQTGDCDARALAFVIIMSHLGVEGVVMVSSVYAHAVAAVAVDANGVSFMMDGRRFLMAETTKKAPLGWVAEEQRTLAKWVVVRFDK